MHGRCFLAAESARNRNGTVRLGGGTLVKSNLQLQHELYRNFFQAVICIYADVYIYRCLTLYILTTWRRNDCETIIPLATWNALWSLRDGHLYICIYITPYTYDLTAERLWNRVSFPFDSHICFRVVTQKLIHIHVAWYIYTYMYTAEEWHSRRHELLVCWMVSIVIVLNVQQTRPWLYLHYWYG